MPTHFLSNVRSCSNDAIVVFAIDCKGFSSNDFSPQQFFVRNLAAPLTDANVSEDTNQDGSRRPEEDCNVDSQSRKHKGHLKRKEQMLKILLLHRVVQPTLAWFANSGVRVALWVNHIIGTIISGTSLYMLQNRKLVNVRFATQSNGPYPIPLIGCRCVLICNRARTSKGMPVCGSIAM